MSITTTKGTVGRTEDPLRNSKFRIGLGSTDYILGFRRVTGMSFDIENIEYREGGQDNVPRQLPGNARVEPITMERGMTRNADTWEWIEKIWNIVNGAGDAKFRADVYIGIFNIYDKSNNAKPVRQFKIRDAWPNKVGVGDLDATANDVTVDQIILRHEGVERIVDGNLKTMSESSNVDVPIG